MTRHDPVSASWRRQCGLILVLGAVLVWAGCGDSNIGTPAGSEGGPCYPDDTCDGELLCLSGLCVAVGECIPEATEICTCTGGESGTRTCGADETWGACECEPNPGCGDGLIDPGESCDSTNLVGHTCESEGFASGDLACDPVDCSLDVSGCYACGPDGTPCDTGVTCEKDGQCQGDVCVGVVEDCADVNLPNECWVAQCNPVTGQCEVETGNDGGPCASDEFCTVNKTCFAGQCVGGEQNDCGMTPPPCQVVTCNESALSCSTVPEVTSTPCVSTDLCQVNSACQNGLCVGTTVDCFFSPDNECNDVACNPANGNCEVTAPDPTADGNPCSQSGDLCQENKTCLSGACQGGTPRDCSHLTAGCDNGLCDATTGQCITQSVPTGGACAEAADQCNTGICDANGDCQPVAVPDNTGCDDFNSCTSGDVCTAGACAGTVDPTCTVYFEQTFESCPPAGWTLGGDWECGVPSNVGPPTAASGTSCLGTVIDAVYNIGQAWASAVADTPWIDLSLSTAPTLSFWIWIRTEGSIYDGGNLKISTDGVSFTLLDTSLPYTLTVSTEQAWGGDQSAAGWQFVTADLTPYQGQQIILRYAFRSDGSVVYPGVYVDDVAVTEPGDLPLSITTPDPLPDALAGVPYSVVLTRQGGSAAAVWSITGGSNHTWLSIDPATGELTGTPTAGDLGPVSVDVYIEEPSNPSNNATATFAFNVVSALYSDDFESACPGTWTLGGDWQCGTPTSGPGNAHSGTQCLATQLAGNYNSNQAWATATATSGAYNLSTTTSPQVRFWMWLDTESCCDGVNLKVSTDGTTYTLVTAVTPAYSNTYDGQQAWGGNQSAAGWQLYTADLSAYAGQAAVYVQLGLRTDGTVTDLGAYVDDLMIVD